MRQISVDEAAELLRSEAPPLLLDCREAWEHAYCRISGDVLLPLGEIDERIDELDPSRPVIVYCHAGVRSVSGAMLLERHGFSSMSMRGGIDQWSLRIDPSVPRY